LISKEVNYFLYNSSKEKNLTSNKIIKFNFDSKTLSSYNFDSDNWESDEIPAHVSQKFDELKCYSSICTLLKVQNEQLLAFAGEAGLSSSGHKNIIITKIDVSEILVTGELLYHRGCQKQIGINSDL